MPARSAPPHDRIPTLSPEVAERERFEVWAKLNLMSLTRMDIEQEPEKYLAQFTQANWESWQAALSVRTTPPQGKDEDETMCEGCGLEPVSTATEGTQK